MIKYHYRSPVTRLFQLSRHDYSELMKLVGREEAGLHLSWLFSAIPNIALAVMFVLWCTAFILVILLFPDNQPSKSPPPPHPTP